MISPLLIAFLVLSGQSIQSFECGNIVTRTSDFASNATGLKAALEVHTEDDHAKNSHECMSEYTLMIMRPDGTSSENQMYSVIDQWGRPIKFWIDGFGSKGRELIATTIEGESWQVLVYTLNEQDRAPEVYDLSKAFLQMLSSACRESLRTVGMTQDGEPVIAGKDAACGGTRKLWKVKQGHPIPVRNLGVKGVSVHARAIPLNDHAIFEPLEPRRPPSM